MGIEPSANNGALVFYTTSITDSERSTRLALKDGGLEPDSNVIFGNTAGFFSGALALGGPALDRIALGSFAGQTNQNAYSVAIGYKSGNFTQAPEAVSIGYRAGESNQGFNAVSIGVGAGGVTQGDYAIGVGRQAGNDNQDTDAIAIGTRAGTLDQGSCQ